MGLESDLALTAFRQMVSGDFGGTITHATRTYPAVLGSFEVQQVLSADGGGFTPMLLATTTVAREDLPANFAGFKRGESVTTSPSDTGRAPRNCQVYSMRDCGALIELVVNDRNQAA